ncbi:MAG: hypothetical protein RIR26_1573 [Pseudomonadota bacterium]|jgi:flagellar basal-body rod protein FlgC
MSFLDGLKISSSALAAERVRMNVISSNLANANTTRTEEGGPYKRKDVVFTARDSGTTFDNLMRQAFDPNLKEVKVDAIVEDQKAPKMVYNPGHPDADKETGMVAMPNISVMEEMVNMITSNRAFEANTTALNATKQMANTAINIGRG